MRQITRKHYGGKQPPKCVWHMNHDRPNLTKPEHIAWCNYHCNMNNTYCHIQGTLRQRTHNE